VAELEGLLEGEQRRSQLLIDYILHVTDALEGLGAVIDAGENP
jgi:hypothetical protein